MRLVARAPITLASGRDQRPGDVFDVSDLEAVELVAASVAEAVDKPVDEARATKKR